MDPWSKWESQSGLHPMPIKGSILIPTSSEWLIRLSPPEKFQALGQGIRQEFFLFAGFNPSLPTRLNGISGAKHIENRATSAGFPRQLIEPLLGALMELQDNVFLHSWRPESGLVAYAISTRAFELVTADAGIGVLASLKKSPEFQHVTHSGSALRIAASDGASRFGSDSGHGYGIGQLFRALTRYDAEIRFRSGDHALSLWGDGPSLTGNVSLVHKAWLQGLTISVRCKMPRRRIQPT